MNAEKWTAAATILLAIVTIFLAWIAYRQLQDGRIENRPWISFANDFVREKHLPSGSLDAKLIFNNVGKSAAFLKNYSIYAAIFRNSPTEEDGISYQLCDNKSSRVLGPGSSAIDECVFDDPEDHHAVIDGSEEHVYYFAKVIYEDSSGNEHFAHYCKFIVAHEIVGDVIRYRTLFCPTYNDVDK